MLTLFPKKTSWLYIVKLLVSCNVENTMLRALIDIYHNDIVFLRKIDVIHSFISKKN